MVTVDLCKSFCARKALAFSLSPVHMYVVYGLENLKTGGMTSSPHKLLVASLTIFFAWIGSSASERSGAYSSFSAWFSFFLIRLRCGVRDGPFLEETQMHVGII